jgi:hypothetical protein
MDTNSPPHKKTINLKRERSRLVNIFWSLFMIAVIIAAIVVVVKYNFWVMVFVITLGVSIGFLFTCGQELWDIKVKISQLSVSQVILKYLPALAFVTIMFIFQGLGRLDITVVEIMGMAGLGYLILFIIIGAIRTALRD